MLVPSIPYQMIRACLLTRGATGLFKWGEQIRRVAPGKFCWSAHPLLGIASLCGTCNSQLSPAHYHCVAHRPTLVVSQLGIGLKLLVIAAGLLTILHNSIGDRKKWILVHIIISLPNNNSKQVSSRHVHIYYINHLLTVQHYDNCQRQVYMAIGLRAPKQWGPSPLILSRCHPTPTFRPFIPSLSVPSFPCLTRSWGITPGKIFESYRCS